MPANPLAFDTFAYGLKSRIEAQVDPPEERAKFSSLLDDYHATVQAEGRAPFSFYIESEVAKSKKVRELFRDENVSAMNSTYEGPDPKTFKQKTANIMELSQRSGRSIQDSAELYPVLKNMYAKAYLGKDEATDSEVFNHMAEGYKLRDQIGLAAVTKGMAEGSSWPEALAASLEELQKSPAYNPAKGLDYMMEFAEMHQRVAGDSSRLRPGVKNIIGILQSVNSEEDLQAALPYLRGKSDQDLSLMWQMMRNEGQGDAVGRAGTSAALVERSLRDVLNKSNRNEVWQDIDTSVELLSKEGTVPEKVAAKGADAVLSWMLTDISASRGAPMDTSGMAAALKQQEKGPSRKLTPEELTALQEEATLRKKDLSTLAKLQTIADKTVNPVKAANWFEDWLGHPLLSSTGVMAAAMLPGGAGFRMAAGTYTDDRRNELIDMGVNPDDANQDALYVGIGAAFADKAQALLAMGKLPKFGQVWNEWVNNPTRGVVQRWIGNTFITVLAETGVEHFQDFLIPALVQDITKRGGDVTWLSKDGPVMQAARATPRTAAGMLLLGIVGSSFATVSEVNVTRDMISNVPMLMQLRYSEAQAKEIAALANDPEAAQAKMRELWKSRSGTVETAAAAGQVVESQAQIQERAEAKLVGDGVLPAVVRTESGYEVRMKDGNTLTLPTLEDAQKAQWAIPDVQAMNLHASVREVIENSQRNLFANEGNRVEWAGRSMTRDQRVEEMPETTPEEVAAKDAMREQLAERSQMSGLQDGGASEAQMHSTATAINEATAETQEQKEAVQMILGESVDEFKDGVMTSVTRLYEGATPLTIVEETVEPSARRIISREGGRSFLLEGIRDTESKLGQELLLTRDDAKVSDQQLIEAFSRLAVDMFVGESRAGHEKGKENRRWLDNQARQIIRSTKLGRLLDAFAVRLAAIFKRAEKIMELRSRGEFHKGLESELAQALGLEQRQHEAAVAREAEQMVAAVPGGRLAPVDGRSEPSFSMGPIDNPGGISESPRDELSDPASILQTLTGANVAGEGSRSGAGQRRKHGRTLVSFADFVAWANAHGRVASPETIQIAEFEASGGEHIVIADEATKRAVKVTKPGFVGAQAEDAGAYLQRWSLANQVFGDDVRIEGIVTLPGEDSPRVVISQPWRMGRDATAAEIREYLTDKGFHEHEGRWVHPVRGVAIWDTITEGNVIMQEDGTAMAIDLQLEPARADELKAVRKSTGFGGETSFSMAPGELPARLAKLFDPYIRNPEMRTALLMEAQARLNAESQKWEATSSSALAENDRLDSRKTELDQRIAELEQNHNWQVADLRTKQSEESDRAKAVADERTKALEKDVADAQIAIDEAKSERTVNVGGALSEGVSARDAASVTAKAERDVAKAQAALDKAKSALSTYETNAKASERAMDKVHTSARDTMVRQQRLARERLKSAAERGIATDERQTQQQTTRARLLASIRTLDAILSALPAEVRGKIGGYAKLASLATDEARLKFIQERAAKIDMELEKFLKKDFTKQIEKLFDRSKPDNSPGDRPKGKLGPDAQEIMDTALAASKMTAVEVDALVTGIDAKIASGDLTAEQEIVALRARDVAELVGDMKNADAARLSEALAALKDVHGRGWADWKLKQLLKREDREDSRKSLQDDSGNDGVRAERSVAEEQAATILGKAKSVFLNLSSFSELMRYAFGQESATARNIIDQERDASNQYEDEIQSMAERIQNLFTQLAGGNVLAGERLRFDLSQRNIDTQAGKMSQMEAITALLMWRQEDGQRHMDGLRDENNQLISSWHYDQAFIDDLDASLSPEGRSVMNWLMSRYGEEYDQINPLFRERQGVNLPRNAKYAPITVKPMQTPSGQVVDPVTGVATAAGGVFSPGSLRSRSRSAIAEPDFRDALQVFLGHNKQMAWWKAYYDFSVDTRAIIGNRSLMNRVDATAPEAGTVMRRWLDTFAQGGTRDAAAGLAVTEFGRRMTSRAATIGLLGRVSTLLVQSTQLAAASVQMPTGAYLLRFGKLMAGQLSWGDAIRSPFIQRRINTAPPIVRQAMESLGVATRPNQITRAVRHLGNLLSGADGLFTGGTYAILLDYHRGEGAKLGLTGPDLEVFAHQEAERSTEQVAQPMRLGTRSITEATMTNPFARVMWSYASEARQKIALMAWAANGANANSGYAFKVAFLTFIVGGLMTQILKNGWKELKGDDDEEKWSPLRLAIGTVAGPLHGVPMISELRGEQGLFSGVKWSKDAAARLIEGEYDNHSDMLKDVDTILSAAGLFNDNLAGIAALSHAGVDAAKLLENVSDGPEGH